MKKSFLFFSVFFFMFMPRCCFAEISDGAMLTNVKVLEMNELLELESVRLWGTVAEFVFLVRERASDEYAGGVEKNLQSMLKKAERLIDANKANLKEEYLIGMGELAPMIVYDSAVNCNEIIGIFDSIGRYKRRVLLEIW
ncbi:MAG: hypothetical protein UW87_C0040G0006 [Candidatus Moranbacteria bacterium GW2011_GWC2_45_10]|nr:MAG: hypothetical protein UW87_C0040G0006 [Candidatus Moranbacteria bacterium GW2011_GWC2_45_10]